MFSSLWRVQVWPLKGEDGLETYDEYNGVSINDFNGGAGNELILSATPAVEVGRVWSEMTNVGHASIDSVDLATFTTKPQLPDFGTSELRVEATDGQGREVLLIISPAGPVVDERNGFDVSRDNLTASR